MILLGLLLGVIVVMLLILIVIGVILMAAIDDLGQATTDLEAQVAATQQEIATLKTASGTPDSAITPITARIQAATAALKGS